MSRSRLVPGAEVVPVPGRGLALRTPEGEFFTIRTGNAREDALLALLTGAAEAPADDELERLVRAFEDAGHLATARPHTRGPPHAGTSGSSATRC